MIYLAAKLSKYEIVDWVGKVNGQRWWDMFVQNLTMDLMEGQQIFFIDLKEIYIYVIQF